MRRTFTNTFVLAATFLLTLVICAVPATAQSDNEPGLEGTWRVQVNVISCTTGLPLGPRFASLLLFAKGGTLTGTTHNPVFQPGQRTDDYGIWQHTHGRSYTADSEAFILFSSNNPPFT